MAWGLSKAVEADDDEDDYNEEEEEDQEEGDDEVSGVPEDEEVTKAPTTEPQASIPAPPEQAPAATYSCVPRTPGASQATTPAASPISPHTLHCSMSGPLTSQDTKINIIF